MADNAKNDQSNSANNADIQIHEIRPLNPGESRFVKPMRMRFTLNGKTRDWDCLKAHDSVASVIYNKTRNKLIFVKQFRPAVYLAHLSSGMRSLENIKPSDLGEPKSLNAGFTMELCAGLADKAGLSPQQTMQEEIEEETGYKVPLDAVKFISSFHGSTGLSGSFMSLYFTEVTDDQKNSKGGGVDDEAIEVLELDPEEVKNYMFCHDHEAPFTRPPAMLVGTLWFLNEYLPKHQGKSS